MMTSTTDLPRIVAVAFTALTSMALVGEACR